MKRMARKQIYLQSHQDQQLKRMVKETGLRAAELIHQAIDAQVQPTHPLVLDPDAWLVERQFIADLIAQGPVEGGRLWRREDLYER